jgi:uncharacterized protein YjaG (DUF416 family)
MVKANIAGHTQLKQGQTALGCAVIDLVHESAAIRSLRAHHSRDVLSAEEWLEAMALEEAQNEAPPPAVDASVENASLATSAVSNEAFERSLRIQEEAASTLSSALRSSSALLALSQTILGDHPSPINCLHPRRANRLLKHAPEP